MQNAGIKTVQPRVLVNPKPLAAAPSKWWKRSAPLPLLIAGGILIASEALILCAVAPFAYACWSLNHENQHSLHVFMTSRMPEPPSAQSWVSCWLRSAHVAIGDDMRVREADLIAEIDRNQKFAWDRLAASNADVIEAEQARVRESNLRHAREALFRAESR
jgi:hypothetical protein